VSLVIHARGIRFKPQGTHTTPRESDVRTSVMYGIDLGVTPPGTIRKMNQDNDCLFNSNPMNELSYDYVPHDYDYVMKCRNDFHACISSRTRALDAI
jgi:hypothetical protein